MTDKQIRFASKNILRFEKIINKCYLIIDSLEVQIRDFQKQIGEAKLSKEIMETLLEEEMLKWPQNVNVTIAYIII